MQLKSICVFCGSRKGIDGIYSELAIDLGKSLANRGIQLIYGGGSIGLMGTIANSVLHESGEVIGVIPGFLEEKEIEHRELTELIVVQSMHERKQKMESLSDGFIAMPGGFGTLEELAEILTWSQLGLHRKPIGLLNVNGFYEPLIQLFDHMVNQHFLSEQNRKLLISSNEPEELLDMMFEFKPSKSDKLLDLDQT